MQCPCSDIGGAAAALWLTTAWCSYTVDPLPTQHYIRKHYLNTQQSEIEFRGSFFCLPSSPAHSSHPAGWTGPLSDTILSLLLERVKQDPLLFIHSQIESVSIWPFYVPESSTDVQYVPARNIWHVCLCVYVCVCVCVGGSVCVCACPICVPVSARIAYSEVGSSISLSAAE